MRRTTIRFSFVVRKYTPSSSRPSRGRVLPFWWAGDLVACPGERLHAVADGVQPRGRQSLDFSIVWRDKCEPGQSVQDFFLKAPQFSRSKDHADRRSCNIAAQESITRRADELLR